MFLKKFNHSFNLFVCFDKKIIYKLTYIMKRSFIFPSKNSPSLFGLLVVPLIGVGAVVFGAPGMVHAATIGRQLDLGMSGRDVTALQIFYAADSAIYPEGLITGYYGLLTQAATKRFQKKNNLEAVGRVGPITLSVLNGQMTQTQGGAEGNVNSGKDDSAPILGQETVRTSSSGATFTWMTNEPANARVLYGNTWPFLLETAPSVAAGGGLSTYQSVTVSGLPASTTMYYVLQSTDGSGNMNMTLGKPFTTK